ncbi:MAG: hypothetical protein LBL90_03045 [Prevotellaceae bacterium]|jgi:hypothetical protein|nr:hypothetical protein [Prevotellaceae bacterium]
MWKPGKVVTILLWVLSIISIALCLYAFIRCGQLNEKNPEEREIMMGVIDPMFVWIYILVIITALCAIVMPLPQLIRNPKGLVRMVFGIVSFGLVILVAYLLSSSDPLPFPASHDPISEGTIKFADVNLYSLYIMFALTIITVLFSSVFVKLFRK